MWRAAGTGGTATYTYNGDGLKIQRVGPDGTTRYYYDGTRPIWETNGAGAMTAQLDRDIFGNLLSHAEPGSRRYYHTDGLGSTVALTDEAGASAASMLYDAWGNVRASTGTGHGKYRFTGAELDMTSDLYHMGARFFDPSIGRWLSEDSVRNPYEPLSLNFYAYVANNPLVLIDPMGTRELEYEPGYGPGGSASSEAKGKAQEILEKLARKLGISLEELLELINSNSGALVKAGGLLMAVGSLLAVLAVAAAGGVVAAPLAAAILAISEWSIIVGAAATVLGSVAQFGTGSISAWAASFNIASAVGGFFFPGMSTSAVARLLAPGKATISQAIGGAAWGLGRAWNLGSWALNWQ